MKLKYSISIQIIVSGIFFITIAFSVFYYFQAKTIASARQHTRELAIEVASHINSHIEERVNVAITLASSPLLKKSLIESNNKFSIIPNAKRNVYISQLSEKWQNTKDINSPFIKNYTSNPIADFLKLQQQLFPDEYGEIFITNRYGVVIGTTGKLTTVEHAQKYWWQAAYDDGKGMIFLDDRGYDSSVKGYVLGIVVPIIDRGKVIGILKSNVNIMGSLMKSISRFSSNPFINAKIVRTKGLVVYENGKPPLSTEIPEAIVDDLKSHESNTYEFMLEQDKTLVSHVPIEISFSSNEIAFGGKPKSLDHAKGNSGEEWHILLFRDMEDIIGGTTGSISINIMILGVFILVALFLSYILTSRISRPIDRFCKAARKIGEGDFDISIDADAPNELRELAQSFQTMASDLNMTMISRDGMSKEIECRKIIELDLKNEVLGHQQAEDELHASERKIRALLENLPISTKIVDLDFNLQYMSSAGFKALKVDDPAQIYGKKYPLDFYPEEFKNQMNRNLRNAIATREVITQEAAIVDLEGNELWFESIIVPVFDEAQRPEYLIVVSIDITERKKNERAIEALAKFPEENPNPVMRFTSDGTLLHANQSSMVLLQRWGIAIGQNSPNSLSSSISKAYATADIITQEVKCAEKTYSFAITPIKGEGYVNVYVSDITEASYLENKLKQSEKTSRSLLDNSPVCHKIVDLDFNIKYINANGLKMLKLSKMEDAYGKPYPFEFFPDASRTQMTTALKEVCKTHKLMSFEGKACDVNGEAVDLFHTITPIHDDDGRIEYITIVSADITERKRMESQVRQSEKMQAIGQLAGGIAHDFNNQLQGIMGFSELLKYQLNEPKLIEYNASIINCSKRSADLVKQLLAFSRKGSYLQTDINIHHIIQEVVEILQHTIDKRIKIVQNLNAQKFNLIGDITRIQNTLLNLAVNARDAISTNGIITFETNAVTLTKNDCASYDYKVDPGEYICIDVSDTGSGIDNEIQEKIFEPFFTTKDQGKGTGMGLAAVYGTIKEHNGHISLDSVVGKGTTFHVLLPQGDKATNADAEKKYTSSKGAGSLLIVDDEEILLKLASDILSDLGYSVSSFSDSVMALEFYQENWQSIDLVILDMIMPKMGGLDLFKAMQKINPKIKVLVASGYSESADMQEAREIGAKGFVVKPFEISKLAEAVSNLLTTNIN